VSRPATASHLFRMTCLPSHCDREPRCISRGGRDHQSRYATPRTPHRSEDRLPGLTWAGSSTAIPCHTTSAACPCHRPQNPPTLPRCSAAHTRGSPLCPEWDISHFARTPPAEGGRDENQQDLRNTARPGLPLAMSLQARQPR
jgi:hypothetical protein